MLAIDHKFYVSQRRRMALRNLFRKIRATIFRSL